MNILVGEKRNLVVDPAKVSATIATRRPHHTQHLGHICEEIFESSMIYPIILQITTMSLYVDDNDNDDGDDGDDDGDDGVNYNHAKHLEDMQPPCAVGRELAPR